MLHFMYWLKGTNIDVKTIGGCFCDIHHRVECHIKSAKYLELKKQIVEIKIP